MSYTSFYRKFQAARRRCGNPEDKSYYRYGGRGITFEWKTFEEFNKDMYASYSEHVKREGKKNTTLERIDNSRGYSKSNCKWATHKEQANNRRNNIRLSFGGKVLAQSEWAKRLGIHRVTLSNRIARGWSLKRALTEKNCHTP